MKKLLWCLFGLFCFVMGTIGTVLPILPTVPLYLLSLFAFSRCSDRWLRWFLSTKLYKKHLEPYRKAGGLTVRAKRNLLLWVSIQMGIAAWLVWPKTVPLVILGLVYLGFLVSMAVVVKTVDREVVEAYKNEYADS